MTAGDSKQTNGHYKIEEVLRVEKRSKFSGLAAPIMKTQLSCGGIAKIGPRTTTLGFTEN